MKKIIALIALMAATPVVAEEATANQLLRTSAMVYHLGEICENHAEAAAVMGIEDAGLPLALDLKKAGNHGRDVVYDEYPPAIVKPLFEAYSYDAGSLLAYSYSAECADESIHRVIGWQMDALEKFRKEH